MNILLVESHYRSRSWFEALRELGDVYIISVLPEERRRFIEKGVPESRILNLHSPDFSEYDQETSAKYIRQAEIDIGFNLNEIVLMDRTLRLRDYDYIVRYCHFVIEKSRDFIVANSIGVTFIEPTWTHEILITRICDYLGLPAMAPVKDKLLVNRFFFFYGYLRHDYFVRIEENREQGAGRRVLESLKENKKPQYFDKFSNRNRLKLSKLNVLYDITRLALFRLKNQNIQPPWLVSVQKKLIAITRAWLFRKFNRFVNINDVKLPYVLITLHVQPEAGIDVVGAKFSNQLEFVRQIARTTPADHCVLVKEHPHDFGRRDSNFYNGLYAVPNVCVLGPDIENRQVIKNAALVVSTAGTSSLEAAISGVPAVTAVKMYFSELLVVPSFDPMVERVDELLEKAKSWKQNYSDEEMKRKLGKIQENTFPGNTMDFKTDSTALTPENIALLKNAFSEVLQRYKKRPRSGSMA